LVHGSEAGETAPTGLGAPESTASPAGSRSLFDRFVRAPLHELLNPPKEQIPALDALRTCAVLFVIFQHVTTAYLDMGGKPNLFAKMPFVRGGFIGVDLFFVLSGYFIGKQLWREVQKTKTVSIKRFMLRRGFRIWPLYFFFLAAVLTAAGGLPIDRWWSDVVFLTNYVKHGVVMGSWSLCTEEQFYILAPGLLLLAAPRIESIRQCRKYLIGLLILLPAIRAGIWWNYTHDMMHHEHEIFIKHIYFPIHTHADGLVMGLLLANVEVAGDDQYKRGFLTSGWCLLLSVVACLGLQKLQREVLDFTGITILFGALVWFLLSRKPAWLSFLKSRVFFVLSRLSFGMYLNHEYMHKRVAAFALAHIPFANEVPALHNIAAAAILVVLAAMVATVTFCLIEHPFLELRTAVLGKKSGGGPTGGKPPVVAAEQASNDRAA
jgi:peptidoglycan/LPS O-acetylase OafA/YrhL